MYAVVRGDTLSSISERERVSTSEIVRLNHLSDANFLREGQILRLSEAPAKPKHNAKLAAAKTSVQKTAKRSRRIAAHKASNSGRAQMEERQALWVAMHTGFSLPDLGGPSFAAAQKAIALELDLTKTALRYLGVPYVWGGESRSGVDCSGFGPAVFRRNGLDLPRTADAQFGVGRRVLESRLQPGDLVFFQTYAEGASHVGIYLGDGHFVHASVSNGVRVDSLSENYYSSRYLGARRAVI
jgi:cell wall-associated NlpC family hydrolase